MDLRGSQLPQRKILPPQQKMTDCFVPEKDDISTSFRSVARVALWQQKKHTVEVNKIV